MTRGRSGFTLVEIVVVIAILGAIAAVTVPALRDIGRAERNGTDAVVRVLERARITARNNGHRVTVTIDPASARYWVDRPALTGIFELPHDVILWSDRPRAHVRFEPTGLASADPLAVQSGGRASAIAVDRLTGDISAR